MAKRENNLVLASLASADLELITPHLVATDLPVRKALEGRDRRIKAVFFPEDGFASVVASGGKSPIEVGIIGREGMTGLGIVLGSSHSPNEVYMQAAGYGQCVSADALRTAIGLSKTLHWSLLRFVNSFLNQTMRTAVTNGRSKTEERLARWILMASDRLVKKEIPLTHEFLAIMLGVNRPGITLALQELEARGSITRSRGQILISDRGALEKRSNGAYSKSDKLAPSELQKNRELR